MMCAWRKYSASFCLNASLISFPRLPEFLFLNPVRQMKLLYSIPTLILMSIIDSSTAMIRRGAFFVFEGLDRSGKSTQVSLLAQHLAQSQRTELIRFPDRSSVIGGLINSYLQSTQDLNDCSIHLLFSANRWERSSALEKQLLEGTHLVQYLQSIYAANKIALY